MAKIAAVKFTGSESDLCFFIWQNHLKVITKHVVAITQSTHNAVQ